MKYLNLVRLGSGCVKYVLYYKMATWELTSKLGPFLDRHLVIPLLEFLTVKGIYDETDLLRGKLELFSNTSMVDFIIDIHKTLYPDQEVPKSLHDKRTAVVENFKRLQSENEPIVKIFQDQKVAQQLQQNRDSKQLVDYLIQHHDFKVEMIDTCYNFAKCLYETGNYGGKNY